MAYLHEFMTIAVVHLVAVASPGPDFAVVVRNSVNYGRRIAMYTSVGVGLGIFLHVAYSLVGLSVVISTTPWLYDTISYCCAAYLIYLAIGALRAGPANHSSSSAQSKDKSAMSAGKALANGFLTNGLNPKATLFFLSLFTAIISNETPLLVKSLYGVYLALATALWFCFLSYLMSTSKIADFVGTKGFWLDRLMGVLLLGLAIRLVTL